MWFLRRRRRPELDLASLDHLSETIARAVALIEERLAPPPAPVEPRRRGELVIRREDSGSEPEIPVREEPPAEPPRPVPKPPEPEPEPEPEPPPEPRPPPREASPGFVLFVPTAAGYRLATPDGVVPEPGERLSVEDAWYRVLRLGPSPLPGDPRRCAFLEPQEATLD
jgi:hypothetical protein